MRLFIVAAATAALLISPVFAAGGTGTGKGSPAAAPAPVTAAAPAPAMASGYMVGHSKVADYAKFRPVFDADETNRQAAGLTNPRVYQSMDNPNELVLVFDMADVKKAKDFTSSKTLKAAMKKAGVKGKPDFWYVTATH
jgi:hypothetical protein